MKTPLPCFEEILQKTYRGVEKTFCEYPSCKKEAHHRAPKFSSRSDDQKQWHWFCLEHAKKYNESWDFFKDYSEEEKEIYAKSHAYDFRPTSKFSTKTQRTSRRSGFKDPFNFFENLENQESKKLDDSLQKALSLFGLCYPFSKKELQKAYKHLVKLYHPDRHHGKKEFEEKLKEINLVYGVLKNLCVD